MWIILLAASQPLRDNATMMLEAGMRPDEVCRIRRENVLSLQSVRKDKSSQTQSAAHRKGLCGLG